jgi:hypothetical protein
MEIIRQTAVATYAVVPLIDAVSRPSYKASPTLAAGDVKIIRHTGGAWNVANIGTLPAIVDASATKQILVTLTATEMTSDNLDYPIIVQFIDQTATKEWDDQEIVIWSKQVPANLTEINSLSPAAVQLGKSAATIVSATVDIIDFAPTVTEFETATIVSPAADFYNSRTAIFTTGTLTNQAREIVASSFNAGTGKTHITVKALTAAPAAGVGFNIV